MEPIPGGFPAAERHPNAAQIRVSSTALDTLEADPAKLVAGFLGGGPLSFDIPGSCSGNPAICCVGNQVVSPCGPLNIDLDKRPTDNARLVLTPVDKGATDGQLDVTVRARLKTAMDLPVKVNIGFDLACTVAIDTEPGSFKDIQIVLPMQFTQDGTVGTTRIGAGAVAVSQLESADVTLKGNLGCLGANFVIGFFIGTLQTTIEDQIKSALDTGTCKQCASGDVAECGSSFATSCTNNVCTKANNECLQELGLDGRLRGVSLFGGFSPGTTGAIDLYEVTGGYATSKAGGLALGMLGGIQPAGTARDRCGPPATAPTTGAIPQSVFFQGNVRPDTNQPFDIAFGVHKSQLGQFAFAGYDGGLLCLTIGHDSVAQLTTDTISILSRSLGKLTDVGAPVAIGLRPQSPPDIVLGKNTFKDDGAGNMIVDEPLLDITFHAMELDFFAQLDEQYVRVLTVVSDVHLPVALQVTAMGELAPVLGDTSMAFSNLSVKNSEALTESPADLAALFPNLLNLVLPQLSGALPSVALPAISGLQLSVSAITAVPTTVGGATNDFLAIYANLATAMAKPVTTHAELVSVDEPSTDVLNSPRTWAASKPPTIALALSAAGDGARDFEYSLRLDRGAWTAWSRQARPVLSPSTFFLQGPHVIEVRARELGKPETIDPTPEEIAIEIGAIAPRVGTANFHGQPGEAGCSCQAGGRATDAAPFALALGFVLLPLGRLRRRARTLVTAVARHLIVLGPIVWLAAVACMPACSCSTSPCGDADCVAGELEHGSIGKWTSVAGDPDRVLVATYDKGLGDLVAVDATDPANLVVTFVDGIDPGEAPTHDPSTYRHGVEGAGPDVGAHTSIAMAGGLASIAYQDLTAHSLKFATETKPNVWVSHTVEVADGVDIGRYTSIGHDADGKPVIAYLAVGVDDGTGNRTTELRLARASLGTPKSETDWTISVVASGVGSCAGLCGGDTCVATATGQTCAVATTDCATACGDTTLCVAGACVDKVPDPTVVDVPQGTGLYPNLVTLGDGRLAIVFYDRNARALTIAVEAAAGASTFTATVLDGVTPGDRGMWADAIVDNGTVHVAYQDALGDQLMYTTWNGTPGTPVVVDDGQRPGDRTHPVGAAASVYVANGGPAIAYQDGLTSDVYVATLAGGAWQTTAVASGPLLDGFSIGTTTAHGGGTYLAWEQLVPANTPPQGLIVQKQ
ncbi:MAG: hypothetical protein NT062_34425 [Proteobacteria bacterium]|nr:hypothetical protein [Pseudomonadota bacterium]